MSMEHQQVVVIDVKMRFWSMVVFMVKWAIASIPALIILGVLLSVFFGIFGNFHSRWWSPRGFPM